MTVINRNRDPFGFLFGDGSDGNLVVSSNTNLPSTLNGAIVEKMYMDLTINAGNILSVANPCKGLILRVRGVLTLNGTISMSSKACAVPGGGSDLFIHYNDIKIPVVGAPGGASPGAGNVAGLPGTNGTDGKCGGGGSGASSRNTADGTMDSIGAGGSAGYVAGGGQAGGGGSTGYESWHEILYRAAWNAKTVKPYGQGWEAGGGDPDNGRGGWVQNGYQYDDGDFTSRNGRGGEGGIRGGGILIVIANRIVGTGSMITKGDNGTASLGSGDRGEGGGAGGGSIVVFYGTNAFTGSMTAPGGNPSTGGRAGGKGGDGSVRDWSLVELASHTRI